MKTGLAPIETPYRGFRFRSRLEARWAVFFDAIGITWQYEPEGFHTEVGRYLPDFYLPDLDLWVEIKGQIPTKHEMAKLHGLGDKPRAAFMGLPGVDPEDPQCGSAWLFEPSPCPAIDPSRGSVVFDREGILTNYVSLNSNRRNLLGDPCAVAAARGARFEHGEQP